MVSNGSGNGSGGSESAEFRATMGAEVRHIWRDIGLLWDHNRQRRAEIEAIRGRIDGAILWAAIAAGGLIFNLVRGKLGL